MAAPRLRDARTFFAARAEQANHEIDHVELARVHLALGRLHDLRGEPEAGRAEWQRAASEMQPLASSEGLAPKRVFVEALLRLGQVEDAAPPVAELRALGLGLPSFVTLRREAGLLPDVVSDLAPSIPSAKEL